MDFKTIEKKWQDAWFNSDVFTAGLDANKNKDKKYVLVEFPFPSADGLHMGHVFCYCGMDIIARFWRMNGKDVLFPFGFDSMGISAEHYAVKKKMHPRDAVEFASKNILRQTQGMGLSFDYSKLLFSSDPEFIKWTQWQFIQLFKQSLAYKAELPINWCPSCRTNLTNEELDENNCCDRCHGPMEKKMKSQWNLAITKYADRLIDDLALVDFPENVKEAQRNWVGRSTGAEVDFGIFKVFTTRVDTIFGVSFCAIAPEHELLKTWLSDGRIENADEVREYIRQSAAKTMIERTDVSREKTGVLLRGIKATNPFTGASVPVFAADYILANYATGTIMAVPAHDERDLEFAKKFDLSILPVIDENGKLINSDFLNGLTIKEAAEVLFNKPNVEKTTKYKMTDWCFSRQMYWGEPIPLVYCQHHGWQPVPEDQLPLLQPHMDDYRPTPDGESPLARATDWVNTTCPVCGGPARRETDTMPQWAGSNWYYIRYVDNKNDNEFAGQDKIKHWLPVDHYNGAFEHVTRHMMYARFWYKALFDLGLVPTPEPFAKRTINGLIMGKDGTKMSKSKNNGLSPDDLFGEFGADASRLFILFLAPWDQNATPNMDVMTGIKRFLGKVENMTDRVKDIPGDDAARNKFIMDISEKIPQMRFNTSIAKMMEYVNELAKLPAIPRADFEALLKVLSLFAPHFSEEIWEKLGNKTWIATAQWDRFDASKITADEIVMAVSVNGKRRAEISIKPGDDAEVAARTAAAKFLTAPVKRVVVVPNKMVNFVL